MAYEILHDTFSLVFHGNGQQTWFPIGTDIKSAVRRIDGDYYHTDLDGAETNHVPKVVETKEGYGLMSDGREGAIALFDTEGHAKSAIARQIAYQNSK